MAKINELVNVSKKTVIVYCIDGIFNSPIVTTAYLIKYRRMTVREAVNHMASVRFGFNLGSKRSKILIDLELKHLNSKSSRLLVYNKIGVIGAGCEILDF